MPATPVNWVVEVFGRPAAIKGKQLTEEALLAWENVQGIAASSGGIGVLKECLDANPPGALRSASLSLARLRRAHSGLAASAFALSSMAQACMRENAEGKPLSEMVQALVAAVHTVMQDAVPDDVVALCHSLTILLEEFDKDSLSSSSSLMKSTLAPFEAEDLATARMLRPAHWHCLGRLARSSRMLSKTQVVMAWDSRFSRFTSS